MTTDTSSNIYLVASEEAAVFYKFDSSFYLIKSKILKSTGTAGKMYVKSVSNYKDTSIFVILGGKWSSATDKDSVAVLRSNSVLDFTGYTCGLLI